MENKFLVNTKQFFAMQSFLKPGIMHQTIFNYLYAKNGAIYAARSAMLAVLHTGQESKLEGIIAIVPEPKKVGNEAMLSFVQCNDKALLVPENIGYDEYNGNFDYRIADLEGMVKAWEIWNKEECSASMIDVRNLQIALDLIKQCSDNEYLHTVKIIPLGGMVPTIIEHDLGEARLTIYIMPLRD